MKEKKTKPKQISFLKDGSTIYELVGDKKQLGFIKFDPISESAEFIQQFNLGNDIYIPPQNDLVSSRTIVLAEYPQEYGEIINLFESIKHYIYKYVDIPETYLIVATLYVMLTWIFDCFDVVPYLRATGDFGTGKSRFLMTAGSICYRACFAGGATTTSPIFRIIEIYQGVTLVFDEADFKYSGADSDMIKILNCGYMRGMPVLRTEGDGDRRQPKGFNVYGPKIIATRKPFTDIALESRCLTQVMAGKPRADIPKHLPKEFYRESAELRNKLLMFRLKNYSSIEIDPSQEMKNLDPRVNQVALPILSIIQDDAVRDQVRAALSSLQDSLNSLKQDEDPALILRALVEMAKDKEMNLGFKEVAKKVNEIAGIDSDYHYALSPSKIGRVNQSVLNLDTHKVNGRARIKVSPSNLKKISSLCQRYAVADVDLVALYYPEENGSSRDKLLENTQEALL
ncbi:MAG: hypothetical protein ABFQ62_05100 [Patescibacteria group bacterium]